MDIETAIRDIESRIEKGFYPKVSCDTGWFGLIAELHEKLVAIDPNYVVLQVKEKFGGLRFYAAPGYGELSEVRCKEFYSLIREAEDKSFTVCEMTGNPGVLMRDGHWLRTLDPEIAPEGYVIVGES